MHKKRLGLITLFLIWSSMVFSQEIFVSSDKYNLYRINIATCSSEFITKIKERPTDISFHPNGKLLGISANRIIFEINPKTGDVRNIHDFDGQYFNSLTISYDGIIYCTGTKGLLMSLDLVSDTAKYHGKIGYEATGDLTFFQGELYAAVTMDRIVHVDINQPENSTVKIQGQVEGNIFGIVSYAESCNEIQTFTLTDGKTKIHQIDFENGTLKFICELDFATYGGASTYEFLGSYPLVLKISERINPTCSNDGQISVVGIGGIGELEYSLGSTNYQGNNTFTSLSSGEYTIHVKMPMAA